MAFPVSLQQQIVDFLMSLPNIHDKDSQRALIYHAGLDKQVESQIPTDKPPFQFVPSLVSILLDYGRLADGRYALVAILEAAKNYVGEDKKQYCQSIIIGVQNCLDELYSNGNDNRQPLVEIRKKESRKKILIVFFIFIAIAGILFLITSYGQRILKIQNTNLTIQSNFTPTPVDVLEKDGQLAEKELPKLLVGDLKGDAGESTWIEISDNGVIRKVPVTLILDVPREEPRHYNYTILFDVTNNAKFDIRIVDIWVATEMFQPLEQIVRYIPYPGLGKNRRFFCLIDKELEWYPAIFEEAGQYILLKPGELETIELKINTLSEGKYDLSVIIQYSTEGQSEEIQIGTLKDVRFLDRVRISSLPRN